MRAKRKQLIYKIYGVSALKKHERTGLIDMRVIIVGCGKVGYTISKSLSFEKDVDVTIIDNARGAFNKAAESVDALLVEGNGLVAENLIEAGINNADLLISVMNADETNILCCVLAKHLGVKHTAARVRNPEYALNRFWKGLGLDMIINPEYATALEISRLMRFPTADDIDTFVGDKVELVAFKVSEAQDFFVGKSVKEIFRAKKTNILLAVIERGNTATIPHGDFVFEKNDIIRVIGRPSHIMDFFALIKQNTGKIKSAVIIGGGRIAYYLAEIIQKHGGGPDIKIIEIDKERCETLSERFPRCLVINADGTDEDVIKAEVIGHSGAVICLTDRDEQNTIIALYSLQAGIRKAVLKINYINKNMVKDLGLGSVVSPQSITSEQIIRYVRNLSNTYGDNVKTVHRIFDNGDERVEAVEFIAGRHARCLNTPLKNLKLKKSILIGCIVRNSNIIIPSGDTSVQAGDSVIIIAGNGNALELDDILA